MDPDLKEVYEERNVARMGYGVCLLSSAAAGASTRPRTPTPSMSAG